MRNLKILLTIAIIALTLFSCQDKKKSSSGKVTLNILHYQDITSPEAKVDEAIFQQFREANPDIELVFETLFNEPFHQKVKALAAANRLPEVVYMWPGGRSAELIENGMVEDLYPYLGTEKERFNPAAVVPQGDGKGLYELPYTVTATHALYVNTKLLKELGLDMPKTFEELVEMVPAITDAGYEAIIMPNKSSWVMQSCLFSALVGRTTPKGWAEDVAKGKASFTDQGFIDSLALVKKFYTSGLLAPSSIQLEYGDGPNLFAEGKSVFMIDGEWRVNLLGELMSEEQQKDIMLTVLPDIKGQTGPTKMTSILPGSGFGMKAGLSKEKAAAAWKFIYHFAGPEASEYRLIEQGVVPAYKIDTSAIQLPPLATQRQTFASSHNGSAVLDNVFSGKVINRINNGLQEIALDSITPEKLAEELDAEMKAILQD